MAKTNDVIVEVSTASTYELDAKKKNAIYIKNISKNDIDLNSFVITDNKLTFTTGSGTKTYTVSNFTGVKYIKTDEAEETFLTDLTTSMIRYTGDYVIKKDKVTGSIYNDNMNYTSYRINNDPSITDSNLSGLNISGGTGKDTITGTIYKDKITGNADNDVISGGKGDDLITGGTGNNIINYSKGDGNDVIYLTKGENFTLNFTDLDLSSLDFQYANNNKDLEISYQNGVKRETITLKDFVKKDVTNNKTLKKPDSSSVYLATTDYNGNNKIDLRDAIVYIDEQDVYLYKIITNKQNVKGTWLKDHIDAKASEELLDKKGRHINMKLNGGNGNDLIESSNYADDITGGKDENIIKYTSLNQINGDRIYLTKGETLWIDLNALGLSEENLSYKVEGKNLNVTVTKDDNSATFTLMNFAAKDITGANTGVYIYTDYDLDLRSDIFMDAIKVSKNFTGSWLSERIEGLLTSPTNAKTNKGLTLSGGAGNDEIYGTNYNDTLKGGADKDTIYGGAGNDNLNGGDGNDNLNGGEGDDTIKGGAGNDIIAGGKGNDSLYGEKGDNVFVFNTGDGVDTIYSGTGADTIRFAGNDATIDLLTFDRPTNSKGVLTNDLVIHYGMDRNSSITIKNYYKTNKKGELTTSIKYIQINDGAKQTIPDVINYINNLGEGVIVNGSGNNFNITSATKYVIGTDENDIVNLASSNQSNIYVLTGEGNNTIAGKTSSDTNYYIYSGSGNDAITTGNGVDIIDAGDGANIITTGSGKKTITVGNSTAEDNQGSTITLSGNNSRSEITTGTGDDEITLNGSSSSYIKIESEGGNNTINYRKDDLSNVYQTNSTITAGAGDDTLNMGTLCDNEIDLGDGDNTITIKGRRNTITTGSGDDEITINHTYANTNTINAGDGNNNIYVTGGGNAVTTGSGNDTIEAAGSGEDTINGGDGANIITAGSGKKTITVGNSTTEDNKGSIITLSGNNSESEITTGTGNDTITLNGSSSSIITIESEGGNNIIDYLKDYSNNPYQTNSTITAGAGNDILNMGTLCDNEIDLGDGDNTITIKGRRNTIATGSGDDEITINHAYANTNTIDAGDGNNTISVSGTNNVIITGSGNDSITFASNYNEVNAGDGNNTISVKSGYDTITAGAGNDTLTITGSTGYDTINLGNGNNTVETEYFYRSELTTGSGNDTITLGHTNNATIDAGSGSNIITTGGGHVNITASGDAKQTITIGDSSHNIYDDSTVTTGGGNDEINIWSYGYDVAITSSGGNNTIKYGLGMTGIGGTSRTTITVGNGNDNIIIGSFDPETGESLGVMGGVTVNAGAGTNTIKMGDYSYRNTITTEGNEVQTITIGERSYENTITTGDGNDVIKLGENSYSYNNTINAGNGNNTVVIGSSEYSNTYHNEVTTGSGDDIITLGGIHSYDNTINAGAGHNVITGAFGKYIITAGNSTVTDTSADNYNIGSEITIGTDGHNTDYSEITTGSGNDTITIIDDSYHTTVNAGDGNNTINFDVDGSYYWSYMDITTGSGNDTINVGEYSHGSVSAGEGNNIININGSYDTITAGSGNNTIVAEGTYNVINTGAGIDTITIGKTEGGAGWNYSKINIGHAASEAVYDEETEELITPAQTVLEGGVENTITINNALRAEVNIYNTQTVDGKYNTINLLNDSCYTKINVTGGHTHIDLGEAYTSGLNVVKTGDGDDVIINSCNDEIDAGNGNNSIAMSEYQSGSSENIVTGSGNDTITIYDKAYVSTGAGNDIINVNVVSAEKYDGSEEYRGNYDTEIAMGAGNDTVNFAAGYKGEVSLTFKKGDGAQNLVNGLVTNARIDIEVDQTCDFYIRRNETTRTSMDVVLVYDGVETGDIMTIENVYKDQDAVELANTNITFSGTWIGGTVWECVDSEHWIWDNVWHYFVPTSLSSIINADRSASGVIEGTKYSDVIYGSNSADTIIPGAGCDIIRPGKGDDIIDLTGTDGNQFIHVNNGDGDLTIKNINNSVYLYMEDIAAESTLLEKHGLDMYIIRSNGEKVILEDIFNSDGEIVENIYLHDKDGTYYGYITDYAYRTDKLINVYEDETGTIVNVSGVKSEVHVTDSTTQIITSETDSVIYGMTDDTHTKSVRVDFSNWSSSEKYTRWTKDGNDLVIKTAIYEDYEREQDLFSNSNTVKTRVVDFFTEYNTVNYFIMGDRYMNYYDIVAPDFTLAVNSTTDNGEELVKPNNQNWWVDSYTYNAGAGNDTIYASGNGDIVYAGDGNDVIYAGAKTDNEYQARSGLFVGGEGQNTYNMYTQPGGTHTIVTTSNQDELHFLDSGVGCYDIMETDNVRLNPKGDDVVIKAGNDILGAHEFIIKDAMISEIDLTVSDEIGQSTTLKDMMLARDIQVSSDEIITGTDNRDYLVGLEGNEIIYGGLGGDTIIAYGNDTVYTAAESTKDTNMYAVDNVTLYGLNNTVYAQSTVNNITSCNYDYEYNEELRKNIYLNTDHYYAYLDQKTTIEDWGGTDSLTLMNTGVNHDGEYKPGGLLNTYIICDVDKWYSENNPYNFDVFIMNQANLTQWAAGNDFNGITIKNNQIETITTADGYTITSEQIKSYALDVVAWLEDNSCSGIFDYLYNHTSTELEGVITNFQNDYAANYWTNS